MKVIVVENYQQIGQQGAQIIAGVIKNNPNVISITGNTLTAKAIGEAIITATQHDGTVLRSLE